MTPVRVAIDATDAFTEAGLTSRLESRSDMHLVSTEELDDRGVLVVAIDRCCPDDGQHRRERAVNPRIPKILVADSVSGTNLRELAGVAALLTRAEVSTARLVSAILAAADGAAGRPEFTIPADRVYPKPAAPKIAVQEFTPREIRVLKLMADGLLTAEIATALSYSERTVKKVIHQLTTRANLRSRQHAVAHALRAGLI